MFSRPEDKLLEYNLQNLRSRCSKEDIDQLITALTNSEASAAIQVIDNHLAPSISTIAYRYVDIAEATMLIPAVDPETGMSFFKPQFEETEISDEEIRKCKEFCIKLVNLSLRQDDAGKSARDLLALFVEILSNTPRLNKMNEIYDIVILSKLKFFLILRAAEASNGTRPFNDMLVREAGIRVLNRLLKNNAIYTLLETRTTDAFPQYLFSAASARRVRRLAKLAGQDLQSQLIAEATYAIEKLKDQGSLFNSKKNNDLVAQILKLNELIELIDQKNNKLNKEVIFTIFDYWKESTSEKIKIDPTLLENLDIIISAEKKRPQTDTDTTPSAPSYPTNSLYPFRSNLSSILSSQTSDSPPNRHQEDLYRIISSMAHLTSKIHSNSSALFSESNSQNIDSSEQGIELTTRSSVIAV